MSERLRRSRNPRSGAQRETSEHIRAALREHTTRRARMTRARLGQAARGHRSDVGDLARGARQAADPAQIRSRRAAEGNAAVRRLQRHAAGQGQAPPDVARADLRARRARARISPASRARCSRPAFAPGDIVHNCFRLSPDARRLDVRVRRARRSAAPVIPGGVGNTEQQVEAIAQLQARRAIPARRIF